MKRVFAWMIVIGVPILIALTAIDADAHRRGYRYHRSYLYGGYYPSYRAYSYPRYYRTYSFVATAVNQRGVTFSARGSTPGIAESRAISKCYARSARPRNCWIISLTRAW